MAKNGLLRKSWSKVQLFIDGRPTFTNGGQRKDLFQKHSITLTLLVDGDGDMIVSIPSSNGQSVNFKCLDGFTVKLH